MELTQTHKDILALIKKSNEILILPSSPIDGDCLGSSLGLYLALKKIGKNVTVVAEEKIPHSYDFLPSIKVISETLDASQDFVISIDCRDHKIKNVRHEIQGNKVNIFVTPETGAIDKEHVSFALGKFKYDVIITVDAADPSQFGSIYENFTELLHVAPVINIDHHVSNSSYGKINLIDIMSPSTTVMLIPLIEALGENVMDADIATLLLAGLITDTGSFQNPNTTPDAFALAAKLIGQGARQQEIILNIYKTKQLSQLRLWGRVLTKIQNDTKYKLVWSVLTKADFEDIGGSPDQTEGVIDELMSNAPNAEIIFLLKEKEGIVKGSIRTTNSSINASELAAMFGGGGHAQAAGFPISDMNIEMAEQKVLEKFKEFQAKRLHIMDKVETISAPEEVAKEPTLETPEKMQVTQEIEPPEKTLPTPIRAPMPRMTSSTTEAHVTPNPSTPQQPQSLNVPPPSVPIRPNIENQTRTLETPAPQVPHTPPSAPMRPNVENTTPRPAGLQPQAQAPVRPNTENQPMPAQTNAPVVQRQNPVHPAPTLPTIPRPTQVTAPQVPHTPPTPALPTQPPPFPPPRPPVQPSAPTQTNATDVQRQNPVTQTQPPSAPIQPQTAPFPPPSAPILSATQPPQASGPFPTPER